MTIEVKKVEWRAIDASGTANVEMRLEYSGNKPIRENIRLEFRTNINQNLTPKQARDQIRLSIRALLDDYIETLT